MVQKTKLELQIESAQKKLQDDQRRLKQLKNQQAEKDRKARNHRLCKRHGFLESILPGTVTLTDEQFEKFVKQHIANKHGIAALANLSGQTAETATAAPTGAIQNNSVGNTPAGAKQNSNIDTSPRLEQNASSGKPQGATA